MFVAFLLGVNEITCVEECVDDYRQREFFRRPGVTKASHGIESIR